MVKRKKAKTKQHKPIALASQNGHKRAVLYARVSTDEQAKGYSLPTQLEACQKYAEQHGFVIIGDQYFDVKKNKVVPKPNAHTIVGYADDFTGTVPVEQRPEGQKAYILLATGKADALIVYHMDRLVRPPEEGDEWDIPILIRSLAKLGREIHTVDRGKIETSFIGLLTAVFDGKGAGDERRRILERSLRGKRAKAKKRWVGTGLPPFGFRKVGKGKEASLKIDEREARIVRRLFSLYLGLGSERRLGLDGIAVLLNSEGVPPPEPGRKKKGSWHPSTINVIISNRACIGEFQWGGETARLPDLAIVDRDIFERAQEQRVINRVECKRNVRYDYLLRGRLRCTCERRMSVRNMLNSGKTYLYYECNRKPSDPDPRCDQRMVRADVADATTWAWLADLFKNPAKLRAGLRRYAEHQRKLLEPKRRRLDELPGLIKECEGQAAQLAVSLKRVEKKKAELAVKSIEDQLAEVSTAHRRYLVERERLTAELEREEMGEVEQKQIMGWAAEIREGIDASEVDFETKRQLCERLKVHVKIEYQDGERGLRLTCVLSYAEKWVSFADSLCLGTVGKHEVTFTDWLPLDGNELARALFGEPARVGAVENASD